MGKLTHQQFLEKISNKPILDKLSILGTYNGSNKPIQVQCKLCGRIWDSKPQFLYYNHGCIVCSKKNDAKKRRKSHTTFASQINEIHYGTIKILSEYEGGANPIEVECLECGRIWVVSQAFKLRQRGCANCISSKGERKIKAILEANSIVFEQQVSFPDLYSITQNGQKSTSYRFDFAIIENGEIKHLIEYDGAQHFKSYISWGGEEKLKKQQEIDRKKTEYCSKKQIKLIRIPYTKLKAIDIKMLLDEK